jgi:hypothetical protein
MTCQSPRTFSSIGGRYRLVRVARDVCVCVCVIVCVCVNVCVCARLHADLVLRFKSSTTLQQHVQT